jgi:hypothetical protein
VAAQALDAVYDLQDKVTHVTDKADGEVKGADRRMRCLEEKTNPIRDILDSTRLKFNEILVQT